jgi:hypothetical protein
MIEIATDARFLNRLFNHPDIRPWVADANEGTLDLAPVIDKGVALIGEHGATCYFRLFDGGWEVHTAVLPEGRGDWAKKFAAASVRKMFTATDAVEILTRVPQGHIAAKALTLATGFRAQFETPAECLFRGERVPATIYNLMLQDWWLRDGSVEGRGIAFHKWLNQQIGREGEAHPIDSIHNRIVGVCLEMIEAGRHRKAVVFYNRHALLVRHAPVVLVNETPVQIKFDAGILTFDGEFRVDPVH